MPLQNGLQQEILSEIEAVANDEKLFCEKNFILRSQAIDDIEFHVIDRLQSLGVSIDSFDQLNELNECADNVRNVLEGINTKMFRKLRAKISQEGYRGIVLMNLIKEYLDQPADLVLQKQQTGYDHLDLFVNGLLTDRALPVEIKDREPGMVFYQKTPARIVFELVKKAAFQPGDVFYDLGSGLGQVVMLVNMLTSVISKGVEFEPAYCHYAEACAADLKLSDVEFINADARYTDYSSGTVFFMYTPFEGKMLYDVLQNLYAETKKRKIRIFTYGPCTRLVAGEHWLTQIGETKNYDAEPGEFVSF